MNLPMPRQFDDEAHYHEDAFGAPLLPIYHLLPAGQTTNTIGPDHCSTIETVDVPAQDHGIAWGYKICRNGTVEKFFNQADHTHRAWSKVYYPPQAGEESGRLEVATTYAPKTGELVHSDRYWWAGTLMQTDDIDGDGVEHKFDFDPDGETLLREQVLNLQECCSPPYILTDLKWLKLPGHPLVYANILNSDHSRWVTSWDVHGMPIEVFDWAQYDAVSGTTGVEYYPGTSTPRFKFMVGGAVNSAFYFKPDGSPDYDLDLSSGMLIVDYSPNPQTHQRFKQTFERVARSDPNGSGLKVTYGLNEVDQLDAQDQPVRQFYFSEGRLQWFRVFNAVVDGVTYAQIDYVFNANGQIDRAEYWNQPLAHPPDRTDKRGPVIDPYTILTPDLLKLSVVVDEALPVPPPLSHFPGGR
jgi:hypothetical protein